MIYWAQDGADYPKLIRSSTGFGFTLRLLCLAPDMRDHYGCRAGVCHPVQHNRYVIYLRDQNFRKSCPFLGKQLFDQVVKTIGLREIWFFGLQYVDSKVKHSSFWEIATSTNSDLLICAAGAKSTWVNSTLRFINSHFRALSRGWSWTKRWTRKMWKRRRATMPFTSSSSRRNSTRRMFPRSSLKRLLKNYSSFKVDHRLKHKISIFVFSQRSNSNRRCLLPSWDICSAR